MDKIKKGDIVGRKSYNKDILFVVERIIKIKSGKQIAILKGLNIRIQADSDIEDLDKIDEKRIAKSEADLDARLISRLNKNEKTNEPFKRTNKVVYTGRILHLDGDKRYSEKSNMFYKKMGLKAFVKNVPESRQANVVEYLIKRYNPDILVVTGHDGMIKSGTGFNDIYNYRNSKYFINTVNRARKIKQNKDLVIFAGACQSYYEELIRAGANFASSPARILIDFMDPLVVAEKVAITEYNKYVTIRDIEADLRDGARGVSGIGARGKKKTMEY